MFSVSPVVCIFLDDIVAAEHDIVEADSAQKFLLGVLETVVKKFFFLEMHILDSFGPMLRLASLARELSLTEKVAWLFNKMPWNCIVYVLEDQISRYLILLAPQDFALKLDLEDERPKIHDIIWSTDILEEILLYMISPDLVEYLVQTSFLQLFEILHYIEA